MRSVTCSMSVSVDSYVVRPDGGFDWTVHDAEGVRFWIGELRETDVHLEHRRRRVLRGHEIAGEPV